MIQNRSIRYMVYGIWYTVYGIRYTECFCKSAVTIRSFVNECISV